MYRGYVRAKLAVGQGPVRIIQGMEFDMSFAAGDVVTLTESEFAMVQQSVPGRFEEVPETKAFKSEVDSILDGVGSSDSEAESVPTDKKETTDSVDEGSTTDVVGN